MARAVAASLVVVHLACVLLGAFELLPGRSDRRASLPLYRSLLTYTGADNSYGFFSPAVGDQIRARLLLFDSRGRSRELRLTMPSREVNLRIDSMLMATVKIKAEDLFARSLAALLLADSSVARLAVVFEYHATPPMAAFRAGRRGTWRELYRGLFRHRPLAR